MKWLPDPKDYPKKIYAKNETYRVIFCKRLKDYGETDPVKRTIRIKAGMSKRETFKTFIHELIHVAHFEGDYNIKHKIVYRLEESLFELLVDNFI